MKSKDILHLERHPMFWSHDILLRAWRSWSKMSGDDISSYQASRRAMVKQRSCRETLTCRTSGSTGRSRQYEWGPRFFEMDDFWWHAIFDDADRDSIYYLYQASSITAPTLHKTHRKLGVNFFDFKTAEVIDAVRNHGGQRPVIWMQPSSLLYLVYHAVNLVDFANAGFVLYTTGEDIDHLVFDCLREQGIDLRNGMRCWDGGASFFTCQFGATHWADMLASISVNQHAELISTDLFNMAQPFIDYRNGDKLNWVRQDRCPCGWLTDEIRFLGRPYATTLIAGTHWDYQYLRSFFLHAVRTAVGHPFEAIAVTVVACGNNLAFLYSSNEDLDRGAIDSLRGSMEVQMGCRLDTVSAMKFHQQDERKARRMTVLDIDQFTALVEGDEDPVRIQSILDANPASIH